MQQGIALLNENTEASLTEAIGFFDRAIAVRRESLVRGDHWMAYLIAGSWMNRGEALTRLARPAQLTEAVHSYDDALAALHDIPLDANPLYRWRQGIAWMNRGVTLHAQESVAAFAEAVRSFDECIAIVRGHPEHMLLLACAWMNRGNSLLCVEPLDSEAARVSAVTALELLEGLERQDFLAAETGLKARRIACQAVGELLSSNPDPQRKLDLVSAATDEIEEGLELSRRWSTQGGAGFQELTADLFRFGVAVYRAHQPHFLTEFVLEHLDPSQPEVGLAVNAEIHRSAAAALAGVVRDLHRDGFASVNTPRFDRLLEALRALHVTRERLRDLGQRQETGETDGRASEPTLPLEMTSDRNSSPPGCS